MKTLKFTVSQNIDSPSLSIITSEQSKSMLHVVVPKLTDQKFK